MGFPYTLPFTLGGSPPAAGFPYTLPFTLGGTTPTPTVVVPLRWARSIWNPERSFVFAPGIPPIPGWFEFEGPHRFWPRRWAPGLISVVQGPASVVVVVPPVQPTVLAPESFLRRRWAPERTVLAFPSGPPSQLVQPVPTPPVPPLLPERWVRPAWSPERTWVAVPTGPSSQLVVVPTFPVPPLAPERWARPAWNPERSELRAVLGPPSLLVVVPGSPVPPSLPDAFLRRAWSPERTYLGVFPSEPTLVPPWPIQPLLPLSFLRTQWNPERSFLSWQEPPFRPFLPLPPVEPPFFARTIWNPERSCVIYPNSMGPTGVWSLIALPDNDVPVNALFEVILTVGNGGKYPAQVQQILPFATGGIFTFSKVLQPNVAGPGLALLGTQGDATIMPGQFVTFVWEGVAFLSGRYGISCSVITRREGYSQPEYAAALTVRSML